MSKNKSKKKSKAPLHIATPFMLAAVCTGITIAAAIKPMDKLKVYANIAFMDSLRSDPTKEGSGLVVKENDIITEYSGQTAETGNVVRPAFGELYAVLRTDAIGVDLPVYWGSTAELLEYGTCQSSGSVVLGTPGNVVISAHVDTYFADLDKLEEGDEVTLFTNYGRYTYKVKEPISFRSSDRKYITPTKDDRLTLYTCKRDLLGASDQRVGFICELTEQVFYTGKEAE